MVVRSGLVGTQGRDRHIVVWEYDWTIVVILRYNLTVREDERKMVASTDQWSGAGWFAISH